MQYNHLIIKGSFRSTPKTMKILNIVFDQVVNSSGDRVVNGPIDYQNEYEHIMISSLITKTGYGNMILFSKEKPANFQLEIYSEKTLDSFNIMRQLNDWFGLLNGAECKIVKK